MSHNPSNLSHEELVKSIKHLLIQERRCACDLIIHLAELEERKLHVAAGYSTLYKYCVRFLGISHNKAYKRSCAAKLIKSWPSLIPDLREGLITESHCAIISPKINADNFAMIIAGIKGKSKRDANLFISRLDQNGNPTDHKPEVEVKFMAHQELLQKLDRAKEVFGPTKQGSGMAALIDKCLDLFLQTHDPLIKALRIKESAGKNHVPKIIENPLPGENPADKKPANARYIPAKIRHHIMLRDEGRCTYISPDGVRCDQMASVEFDHIIPFSRGGQATADNLRLRCRSHNLYAAAQIFGRRFMENKMGGNQK